jgi:nucleolar pre-ribosomal-associated protein 2
MFLLQAVGSSQEALLQLEKDTAGSAIELNNAAQILGIDLTLCASSHGAAFDLQYFQIESAPKEEWVLRWLLKRLKIKSYRLDPASFVLFEWLLHRVPRRAIAVTLTEYKFLTVFKDIVIDLEQCVFDLLRDRNGGLHAERSDSESSHTLGGSPVRKRPGTDIKGGRKRKRTEATSPEPKPSMESAVIAYLRFLNFLHSLMSLVHQTTDHDTNSQLHLQQALRTEADFAGSVLGRMLRLSARLLIELSTKGKGAEIQSLLHGTTAVFGIWDLNKSNINNSASNAGNVSPSVTIGTSLMLIATIGCVLGAWLSSGVEAPTCHSFD